MSEIRQRQNTLLVPPILRNMEVGVDKHLTLTSGHKKLGRLLGILICSYLYEKESWSKSHEEYLWTIYTFFQTKLSLGLEEKLSSLDECLIRMISRKSIDTQQLPQWIKFSKFFLTKHEYYGMILEANFKLPVIKEVRRKRRYHHHRYVGVGYKDKGATTEDSWDGSPSWQQVVRKNDIARNRTTDLLLILGGKLVRRLRHRSVPLGQDCWKNTIKARFTEVGLQGEDSTLGFVCNNHLPISEEFWIKIHQNLGTKVTDGKYFLFGEI